MCLLAPLRLLLRRARSSCRGGQVGEFIAAGDHDVAICRVEQVLAAPSEGEAAPVPLSTGALRDANLITAAGRAVEPQPD